MRISISIAAITAVLCGAAQAHNYNCEFQKDGTALNTCHIESTGGGHSCQYDFSANLRGICAASGDASSDLVVCAVTTPAAAAASFHSNVPRDSVSKAMRALSQKPGFVAGGLTIAAAGKAVVAGAYVEQQGAPTLAGVCTP